MLNRKRQLNYIIPNAKPPGANVGPASYASDHRSIRRKHIGLRRLFKEFLAERPLDLHCRDAYSAALPRGDGRVEVVCVRQVLLEADVVLN